MKFEEHIGANMTGGSREGANLPVSMSTPQQVVRHSHKHNLRQRFELVKTLGQGTYGKVKLAVDRATGQQVAIKYIRKTKIDSELDLRRIRREIDIMSSLHHPHIISIYEVFENKEKIILVMEYANGGELYDYINERKQLTEEEARKFFRQIASAIHNCHQHGIVHRDLKLENILLDCNFNVKIADFGLSNHYNNTDLLRTFCGSPLYASPEIVNGLPYSGPEVDCWSLGVLLYTLVYGAMPFDGSDFKRLRRQISEGDYYEPSQPSDASGLIARLLTVDPVKRAKMADICEHWWVNLNHPCTPTDQEFLEEEIKVPRKYRGRTLSLSSSDSEGEYKCPHSSHHRKVVARRRHGNSKTDNYRWSSEFEDEAVFMADDLDSLSTLVPSQIPSLSANDAEIEESSLNKSDCLKTLKTSNSASNSDSNEGEISSCAETTPSRTDVFDSRKKPKRGILKNKGKYTGHDSGCVLDEHQVAAEETLPSAGRKESSESAYGSTTSYELADIESVLNALDDTVGSSVSSALLKEEEATTRTATITRHPSAGKYDYQQVDFDSSSEHTGVVRRRPKSILKKHSKYGVVDSDQLKRYSIGSQSSNSSADLLDFSYDSGEGEHYMTQYYTHVNELTCGQYITGEEESTPKNGGFLMPDEETLRKIALMDAISRDTIRQDCEVGEQYGLAEMQSLYQQAYATCNALN